MHEIYEINIDTNTYSGEAASLYKERIKVSELVASSKKYSSEVSIVVTAYNRLDKTKECVESVLKYSQNVDFDLILVDNGSSDDTFEYFKSVPHNKVRIVRITKNVDQRFALCCIELNWISQYVVLVPNDIIVTENWLYNLLAVAKSDPKIGMVNPVCSNVSNLQQVDLDFQSREEMQKKAAAYNKTDPAKWHERLRLITLGTLFKTACLYAVGMPLFDVGFVHDFADDDITFRVRRAGYKAVLAGDTWIHHNHDFRNMEDKDPQKFMETLQAGRSYFKEKYYGIDAWDDVNDYICNYLSDSITPPVKKENVKILGIETKCGTPALDIKNVIRRYGIYNAQISAFTSDAKYYTDLKTICEGNVVCANIELLRSSFQPDHFDYIIIHKNINEFNNYEEVIETALSLLKKGGQLFLPLKNVYDVNALLLMFGYNDQTSANAFALSEEQFVQQVKKLGAKAAHKVAVIPYQVPEDVMEFINLLVDSSKEASISTQKLVGNLLTEKSFFKIIK